MMKTQLDSNGGTSCNICGKFIAHPKNVKRHMLTHTGEKPFSCHLCSYQATQQNTLKRHLFLIHYQRNTNTQ